MYDIFIQRGALAQLVAHNTGSVGVTSSSLVRSIFYSKSRKGSFLVVVQAPICISDDLTSKNVFNHQMSFVTYFVFLNLFLHLINFEFNLLSGTMCICLYVSNRGHGGNNIAVYLTKKDCLRQSFLSFKFIVYSCR